MKRSLARLLPLVTGLVVTTSPLLAEDWPHWLGPKGDNIAPAGHFDTDLNKWKVAWQAKVGRGYSAVTVAQGRAYTQGHDEKSQETLYCFDAKSGEVLWKHSYDAQLLPRMHPGGPNATPMVADGKVVAISKDGQVICLAADKGGVLWKLALTEVAEIKLPQWGFASSPVLDGNQLLFSAGKVVAVDFATGKVLWSSKTAYHAGYTTAVPFEHQGRKLVVALDGKGVSILTGNGGEEIDRRPFKAMFDMVATTPYVMAKGGKIFISGNTTSEMLGFDGQKLNPLWTSTEIKNAMNNSVIFGGVLYGIDGKHQTPGSRFVSVNTEDGKVNWVRPDFGYGTVIGVGDSLLALTENGELVALMAGKEGYNEISRRQVLGKTCWTTPVFANDRIYVRNDQGELICLSPG